VVIVTTAGDDIFNVETTLRRPGVYLDQDSLADIARTRERRQRFLAVLETKGTLLFSWTNAIDLSGPQGDTVTKIRELLAGIGPNWLPLGMNPWKVARKESGEEAYGGSPCVSQSFLVNYYPYIHGGVLDLATVVDLVHEDRAVVLNNLNTFKSGVDRMVQGWRAQYIADANCLDHIFPPIADAARPTASILRGLTRLVTCEARAFTWMPNDGVDFMHAAVAAGYADFVVLDRQWKRRVLEVAPPPHLYVGLLPCRVG
jgi:hypothetical protein